MKVEVRFFASLREATGASAVAIELDDGADFDGLLRALATRLGDDAVRALRASNVRVARNQALEAPPFGLVDGDEIAFMPPVTGG